jgi:hypothetical protein
MNISFKNIRKELVPFIEKIWVFENNDDLPLNDLKTIFPNGRFKIIVPLKSDINIQGIKGALTGSSSGIFLAGMIETPIRMDDEGKKGTIGIEFKMHAAYRVFNCHLKYFNNQLVSFEDIFGRIGT